jgi:hypothetical protein
VPPRRLQLVDDQKHRRALWRTTSPHETLAATSAAVNQSSGITHGVPLAACDARRDGDE